MPALQRSKCCSNCARSTFSLARALEKKRCILTTYSNKEDIHDQNKEGKQTLLHFMYWDCLPEMEELSGVASTLMAQHLLAAADRYAVERLRLICEVKLCEDVSINTVATTLALAEQHHCFQLKTVCLKFVAMPENLKAVMQTEGFEHLKLSCPSILTEVLKYVARVSEHMAISHARGFEVFDGSDGNGRRVKPRLI